MKSMRFAVMAVLLALSLVMMAYAQEKGCEFNGKTYEHHDQVWNLKGGNKCWICEDGEWVQGMRHIERYCKGKF